MWLNNFGCFLMIDLQDSRNLWAYLVSEYFFLFYTIIIIFFLSPCGCDPVETCLLPLFDLSILVRFFSCMFFTGKNYKLILFSIMSKPKKTITLFAAYNKSLGTARWFFYLPLLFFLASVKRTTTTHTYIKKMNIFERRSRTS